MKIIKLRLPLVNLADCFSSQCVNPDKLLLLRSMKSTLRFLVFILAFAFGFKALAQKTDVVYLINGDKITGEIKSMDFGKLKYKTDHSSTIYIEWDDIVTLKSDKFLDISLRDGRRIFASLVESPDTGYVLIQELVGSKPISLQEIVSMVPIKNTFWSRIDGVIELGGNYTKASDVAQVNGKFNAEYRGVKFLTGYRTNAIFTSQPERETTQKADAYLYYTRFVRGNSFIQASATGSRNTELGLDWRMLYGGSVGHDFLRSVHSRLDGNIGIYYNGEKGLDSATVTSSVEAAFAVSFKKLKYDSPKVDLYTQFTIFPSLTESERVRIQYDLQTKFEIIADFYVGVDYYLSYDNKPRTEDASELDYGIIASIGYNF